jgi:hypothetical protein
VAGGDSSNPLVVWLTRGSHPANAKRRESNIIQSRVRPGADSQMRRQARETANVRTASRTGRRETTLSWISEGRDSRLVSDSAAASGEATRPPFRPSSGKDMNKQHMANSRGWVVLGPVWYSFISSFTSSFTTSIAKQPTL